jgi:hypothetical protein
MSRLSAENPRCGIMKSSKINDDEDTLFEMANIYPADSRLPMTVWVGPRGHARHDVRVKVNMAPR